MKKQLVITIVVALIVGGAGFVGGMQYQKRKTPAAAAAQGQRGQFGGGRGTRGGANGGGFVGGQIISKDDKSITISTMGGGSKIVFYSASTQISKPAPAQAGDLAVGQMVIVSGQADSTGSVTAQTIQIRPDNPARPQGQSTIRSN